MLAERGQRRRVAFRIDEREDRLTGGRVAQPLDLGDCGRRRGLDDEQTAVPRVRSQPSHAGVDIDNFRLDFDGQVVQLAAEVCKRSILATDEKGF